MTFEILYVVPFLTSIQLNRSELRIALFEILYPSFLKTFTETNNLCRVKIDQISKTRMDTVANILTNSILDEFDLMELGINGSPDFSVRGSRCSGHGKCSKDEMSK
jgi:hypothetical protein